MTQHPHALSHRAARCGLGVRRTALLATAFAALVDFAGAGCARRVPPPPGAAGAGGKPGTPAATAAKPPATSRATGEHNQALVAAARAPVTRSPGAAVEPRNSGLPAGMVLAAPAPRGDGQPFRAPVDPPLTPQPVAPVTRPPQGLDAPATRRATSDTPETPAQPAASLANHVRSLIQLSMAPGARVDTPQDNGAVTTLGWVRADAPPRTPKQRVTVTRDGVWLSFSAVHIATRTTALRRALRWTRCLAARGVRVLVDDGAASKQLATTLGLTGRNLLIRCDGGERCAHLGHKRYPVVVWPKGAAIGAQTAGWFSETFGCTPVDSPDDPSAETGATDTTDTTDATDDEQHRLTAIGERVRGLIALETGRAAFLVGSARQGDAVTVTLHQPSARPPLRTFVVDAQGEWLLRDAIAMGPALRRAQMLRRRVDCLARMGAAIYVNDDTALTQRQLARFGPLVRYVVRDCRVKPTPRRCASLSKTGFPAFVVGKQVISKDLRIDAIRSLTACP